MNLRPSPEQRMMVEAARGHLERTHTPGESTAFDADAWKGMCGLGWPAMALPEEHGGLGTLVDLCLVAEEHGRVALTSPLATAVAAGALPIALGGTPEQIATWVSRLAEGEAIATMAVLEEDSGSEWSAVRLSGARSDGGWTLSGAKVLVPWADVADVLLVACDLEGRGASLVLVDPAAVTITPSEILGADPRFEVSMSQVAVAEADVLPGDVLATSLAFQTVLTCAQLVGLCDTALAMSVQYANERHQFGRPIGSFQAVSYRCVDMKLAIDAARLFTHKAAWQLDDGRDAGLAVAAAKAYANEMVDIVAHSSHQVHGAIGFSTEYDLHLYTRRARALVCNHGTWSFHLEGVAAGLGL